MCLQMVLPFGYQYVCTAVRRDRYAITPQLLVQSFVNPVVRIMAGACDFLPGRRDVSVCFRFVESS